MLINCTSVYHKKHTFKRSKGENCVCVCAWVGRLLWKCISCITFLFLIFHALWIYLNPLRWIEKEKKGKAEVRDMQNKKHPPLANVLPLSSFGFLILSCLFSLEGIFLKSFADTEPKAIAILCWRGRKEDRPSVCCILRLWVIPKMVDGQSCMF